MTSAPSATSTSSSSALPTFHMPHFSLELLPRPVRQRRHHRHSGRHRVAAVLRGGRLYDQRAPPRQHGAGGPGRRQHRLGALRRHPRHRRHRAHRRQREGRRPNAHRRHGACARAHRRARVPHALRGAHPHAHHRRHLCCTSPTACRAGATSRTCASTASEGGGGHAACSPSR